MTVATTPKLFSKPRRREVAFFAFGAGVFALGLSAFGTICVVCAHPATVAAIG